MTYKVLARKWRPRLFSELVGQQHVVRALTNSINNQKLHHAYLFTGTRGVGKTTIARVFAKSLNCESGPTPTPCLTCPTCRSIEDGRYVDLIEVDAASRTRVEDTKELLDNVQYLPSQGRYKIYLIDEVHMLSGHSFNALLKTLEEPPSHVIFLLATTDPQKIPVTVLSRCLQFTLKPLMTHEISLYLETVAKGEGIRFETTALTLLAKAAKGSLRDSLSLLDQAIAYTASNLSFDMILDMLGTVDDEIIYQVFKAIAEEKGEALLSICQQMAIEGVNFSQVLERFIDVLHQVALCQLMNSSVSQGEIINIASAFSKEDIQLFYDICLKGLSDLGTVPNASIGFEMTVLRMLSFKLSKPVHFNLANKQTAPVLKSPVSTAPVSTAPSLTQAVVPAKPLLQSEAPPISIPQAEIRSAALQYSSKPAAIDPLLNNKPQSPIVPEPWLNVVEQLPLVGMAKTVIMHCNLIEKTESHLTLGLEANYQAMLTSTARSNIEKALKTYWKAEFQVVFEVLKDRAVETPAAQKNRINDADLANAKENLVTDPCFNDVISVFDGKVEDSSIELISTK